MCVTSIYLHVFHRVFMVIFTYREVEFADVHVEVFAVFYRACMFIQYVSVCM